MASPLSTRKQTVNLAVAAAPASRIRRNPPPAQRKEPVLDREDRDKISFTLGVFVIAAGIAVAIAGLGAYAGWSPSEVELYYQMD